MLSSKGKKSPLIFIILILIINISISTTFLPFMAFAFPPPPPLSGCAFASHDCHYKQAEAIHHNRKIIMGVKGSTRSALNVKKRVNKYEEELRNVPSGPDPLHHNGAPQKRSKPSP